MFTEDDKNTIIKLYTVDKRSISYIENCLHISRHLIRRVLVNGGIIITCSGRRRVFTEEHKQNISNSCKGRPSSYKGRKSSRATNLRNMQAHLRYIVSLEWLEKFDDLDKLKYLHKSIQRPRDSAGFTSDIYMQFIEKFYYDEKFNDLYYKWKSTGDKWIKPSLDHVVPKSKGGTLGVDNLQFISWLENSAKKDIDNEVWLRMKVNINYYL